MRQHEPILSLRVLYQPHKAPEYNQRGNRLQRPKVILPVQGRIPHQNRHLIPRDPPTGVPRHDNKKTQRDHLRDQTRQNNLSARLNDGLVTRGGEDRAGDLACQDGHVYDHVYLGEPAWTDHGVALGAEGDNDTTKCHIDRGGDERRGGEEEEVLEDPGPEVVGVVV